MAISCGGYNPSQPADVSASCPAGIAQILVGDNFQRVICGCLEGAGTIVYTPGNFNCTVNGSATFLFNTSGSSLTHQIESTSVPQAFPSSPVGFSTFGFLLNASGIYPYQDAFNTSIRGQLIVQ